jgi:hypothetical protein
MAKPPHLFLCRTGSRGANERRPDIAHGSVFAELTWGTWANGAYHLLNTSPYNRWLVGPPSRPCIASARTSTQEKELVPPVNRSLESSLVGQSLLSSRQYRIFLDNRPPTQRNLKSDFLSVVLQFKFIQIQHFIAFSIFDLSTLSNPNFRKSKSI